MLLSVDDRDPRPLYRQLAGELRQQILDGRLKPGEALPSVRDVAAALEINLHTVRRAYQELRDAGMITQRLGQKAKVAPLRQGKATEEAIEERVTGPLAELIAEAKYLGLSEDDFRVLVEQLLTGSGSGGNQDES
jgi:GntR family transcriptional regulator